MAQTLSEGPVIPDADGGEQISATGVNELRTLGSSTNAALASVRADAAAGIAAAEDSAAVAAQIGTLADSTSRARDTALEGLIAGMEGMTYVGAWASGTTYRINDVVTHGGDSWARLTTGATGEPGVSATDWGLVARKGDGGGFGALTETATVGLYDTVNNGFAARLTALEYKSGPRNITGRMSVQPASGTLYLERIGDVVWCDISGIRMPSSAGFVQLVDLFPDGFRPRRIQDFATAKRNNTDPAGGLRVDLSGTAYFYVVDSTRDIRGVVSWPTRDAPPATLPGTPA